MWDMRWIELANLISTWSKDKSRKTSAVIVDDRNVLISIGWNGFPRKINDNIPNRHKRPNKYLWTEHAERNAIYNAASNGFRLLGCTMYLPWYPCSDCARAIIQSGIKKIICVEPDWDDATYKKDFEITKIMFAESCVDVKFVHWMRPPERKDV